MNTYSVHENWQYNYQRKKDKTRFHHYCDTSYSIDGVIQILIIKNMNTFTKGQSTHAVKLNVKLLYPLDNEN